MKIEEWTCGHVASAMCAECYRLLAARANELAEENLDLRSQMPLNSDLAACEGALKNSGELCRALTAEVMQLRNENDRLRTIIGNQGSFDE